MNKLKILIFAIFLVLLDQILGTLFTLNHPEFYTEIKFKEFYKTNKNIDLLFIGSSHTYKTFNPLFFDKTLNLNSFNLGTSAQNPTTSYFLLKEALRTNHKPKFLVLDGYWKLFEGENYDFKTASLVFKNLNFSTNKLDFFFNGFDFPESFRIFSKTFVYRDFKNSLWEKVSFPNEILLTKGFVQTTGVQKNENLEMFETHKKTNKNRLDFFVKTIKLAQKNGIKIFVVSTPLPQKTFQAVPNYEKSFFVLDSLCKANEVVFFDFNFGKNKLVLPDSCFADADHLNVRGVELFQQKALETIFLK